MQIQLRPNNFKEFIGQSKVKKTLIMMINSSKKRNISLDHILLHGPPGLGKTSLATIISKSTNKKIKYAQGSMIEKKSDILSLLSSIDDHQIIFIDEIHAMHKSAEEFIYSAIEDGVIDILVGPEGDTKMVRLQLPPFTLIGATTKQHLISEPLRSRFGVICKLKYYSNSDINIIIKHSLLKMKVEANEKAVSLISSHAWGTPRIANNLLKRIVDYITTNNIKKITVNAVKKSFDILGIYEHGLSETHIEYLLILNNSFKNSWTSIENIASILGIDKRNAIEIIESPLISLNLITKTSRGRKITSHGISYLNKNKLL